MGTCAKPKMPSKALGLTPDRELAAPRSPLAAIRLEPLSQGDGWREALIGVGDRIDLSRQPRKHCTIAVVV